MDYSKIINLNEWPPKPEQKKEVEPEKTDTDVPDWAKPFVEAITKTEELIKNIKDQQEAKTMFKEPLLGKPETENGISPAVQDYLNKK
ncbi:hypothetical protein SAMN05444360_102184 [Chryseobacterium carnipullorum]|uniref:hypothetical protein n=1 Tax=Chryseobacterium carnipullorum TaxID=1124835 RepID=UPI00090FB215|nr:hypothetical protein [Chryseobacterium carnipullorum]SHL52471.1 hypothetical protein SAMN05444360_102184 [Chryseobacterium carnipullorum]